MLAIENPGDKDVRCVTPSQLRARTSAGFPFSEVQEVLLPYLKKFGKFLNFIVTLGKVTFMLYIHKSILLNV